MLGIVLAVGGLAAVLIAWGTYLATIPRGEVPARPIATLALQLAGIGLAIAGLVHGLRGDASPAAVIPPAAIALIMGPMFLFVLSQRRTPIGNLRVAVGDALLPFAARTADGAPFDSGQLAGRRVLLKFFRGSW